MNDLVAQAPLDLEAVEAWWIEAVRRVFATSPLKFRLDAAASLRAIVADVLDQARAREAGGFGGVTVVGAVLQHLVGAKLDLALPDETIDHHGASVADAGRGRAGDFFIGSSAVHVTTAPGEAVIRRCAENIAAGLRSVLVTLDDQVRIAEELARRQGVAPRADVLGATQFPGANLLEAAASRAEARDDAVRALFRRYNKLVEAHETDPSLRVAI